MRSIVSLLAILATLGWAGLASAQTADGSTPAEETVCEAFGGAAWGLCNAYCEAMDCDSELAEASDRACQKVADNFFKMTGQDLPCEFASVCPIDLVVEPNGFWWLTEPPFAGLNTINMIATFQNTSATDFDVDSTIAPLYQIWSVPSVLVPPALPVVDVATPDGTTILPGDIFSYNLIIDVSGLPAGDDRLAFRGHSVFPGNLLPDKATLQTVSFTCE